MNTTPKSPTLIRFDWAIKRLLRNKANDLLQLPHNREDIFAREKAQDLYPEYFLLCIKEFNDVAKDSLDEWVYYLKNSAIPEGFTAPGLKEASV